MKAAVYLAPLIALTAAPLAAELNTMTIQNLPLSAEENRVVCYDSASGKLGRCDITRGIQKVQKTPVNPEKSCQIKLLGYPFP